MKIKDQIRARREQLGISVTELAKRVDVSSQSVRYWESGRSYPGKAKVQALEAALSATLDWSEGVTRKGKDVTALMEQKDIELLLLISRLPVGFKNLFGEMARLHLAEMDKSRPAFSVREADKPISSFSKKAKVDAPARGKPEVKRSPARRRAA